MDILVEAVKWVVILGLIYYILDKTPIGVPIKTAMVRLMLYLWSHVKTGKVSPALSSEMNRLGQKYGWSKAKNKKARK